MTIEMTEFTKGYLIPKDGKYLVKTISTSHLKTPHYVEAKCTLITNDKGTHTSVDVTNQTVTHISKQPIL